MVERKSMRKVSHINHVLSHLYTVTDDVKQQCLPHFLHCPVFLQSNYNAAHTVKSEISAGGV